MQTMTLVKLDKYDEDAVLPEKKWFKIDHICKVVRGSIDRFMCLVYILYRSSKGAKKAYVLYDWSFNYKNTKNWLPWKCMCYVDGMPQTNILDDGHTLVVPEPNSAIIVGPHTEYGVLTHFSAERIPSGTIYFRSATEFAIVQEIYEHRNRLAEMAKRSTNNAETKKN